MTTEQDWKILIDLEFHNGLSRQWKHLFSGEFQFERANLQPFGRAVRKRKPQADFVAFRDRVFNGLIKVRESPIKHEGHLVDDFGNFNIGKGRFEALHKCPKPLMTVERLSKRNQNNFYWWKPYAGG